MREITVNSARHGLKKVLVDDVDYEWLAAHNCNVMCSRGIFYALCYIDGKAHLMHRLLVQTDQLIDHKDGNGLNNQRANLRACTNAQNQHNRKPQNNNTTGYKGVKLEKRTGKYEAYIITNGRAKSLGTFLTKHDAALAYNRAAIALRGEFARLNDVP
jgi:hypothetical protein